MHSLIRWMAIAGMSGVAVFAAGAADDGAQQPQQNAPATAETVPIQAPFNADEIVAGIAELAQDVAALRKEVKHVQESLDSYTGPFLMDLKRENQRLREEIARITGQPPTTPATPAQDVSGIPGAFKEAAQTPPVADAKAKEPAEDKAIRISAPDAKPATPAVGAEGYSIVKEWGRTPEDAARLGANVSSLKGYICTVRTGATDEELTALGRKFRTEFDNYDNINIEVFDEAVAARSYAERNEQSTAHHVFSISKHKKSGRDVMLLLRGETVTVVSKND